MIEVRFTQDYQGQHTGPHFYRAGQVVAVDAATAGLLIADGRAEMVGLVPQSAPAAVDWGKMKVAELRAELDRRGMKTTGNKAALVARLRDE